MNSLRLLSFARSPWLLLTALVLACAQPALAVDQMFLKLTGIAGESQDGLHLNEIDLQAFSWGASSSTTYSTTSAPNVQDLTITKLADKSTPSLLLRTLNGAAITEAVLVVRRFTGYRDVEYLKITLTDVRVTAVDHSGSTSQDRVVENVRLTFRQLRMSYTPVNVDGTAGTAITIGWDVSTNRAI